ASSALSLGSDFARASLAYLLQRGAWTVHAQPWAGTNRFALASVQDGRTETLARPEYPFGLRADVTRDLSWGDLRVGFDGTGGSLSRSQVGFTGNNLGPMQTTGGSTVTWGNAAGWTSARVKLDGDRLAIQPSTRVEWYGLTGEVVVDPRLA